jgi:P4 family phage/plasmid primase-like protien
VKAVKSTGPYARAAAGYWSEGWSPIPLPPQRKYPPERGWTGGSKDNSGTLPSKEQIEKWIAAQGDGNVALRLPKNIIGIDVDLYDGKAGAATLAAAEEEWGPLQPTWMSSSRTDGSGIRLYRVPEGLQWPGELPQGKGVEIVKWDHRYAIVAPSIHPEGREYVWINTVGESTTDGEGWEFPGINTGEITELDQRWVDGLTGGKKWQPKSEADLTSEEVTDWLKNRDNPDGKMCEVMERTLAHHLQNIRPTGEKGGAHEGFTKAVWAILGDAAAGHKGIRKALERIQAAFREASKGRRSVAERNGEWRRSLEEGVRKVAAEGEPEDEDLCEATAVSHVARTRKRSGGSGDFDYARNDAGNARRFALRYRDAIVWVEGLGGWHIWDSETGLWRLDADGEATRMALSTVAAIRDEVKFLEDEKEKAKLLAFVSASGNDARIKAMLNMARSLKGMTAPAARFNANSRHVVVGNGTIELLGGGAGIKFRQSLPDDWDSIGMEVKYVAAAASDLWEKFLRRSIPDDEVREWVQRAAGYSLLGANPERLFFMVQGETSSGKSTFGEVIRDVLGQYGAPYELNLFRSQKEQGPNVQLVRLLPKRFILASEASAEVHLHADQIKRVTGSEALSGRLNRSNEMVERVPAFTPWLVTNSTPTIRGADMALYRRIYTIPFNETISVEDEDVFLGEKLRTGEGAEAVLSWIVEGWKRYAASGLRDAPAAVISATLGTREQLSEFDVWMTEQCVRGAEETAITEELYSNYSMWCDDASVKRESKIEFGRMLSKRGLRQVRVPVDSSKRLRGWMGVSIRV